MSGKDFHPGGAGDVLGRARLIGREMDVAFAPQDQRRRLDLAQCVGEVVVCGPGCPVKLGGEKSSYRPACARWRGGGDVAVNRQLVDRALDRS